ncbi:MAG: hypothetical protein V4534_08040 [Myxococcota bacterium]
MAHTNIMTVRLDAALLTALKERARHVGRSVSAEVTQMIKQQVAPATGDFHPVLKSEGMFSQFEAPTLEELGDLRRTYTQNIGTWLP